MRSQKTKKRAMIAKKTTSLVEKVAKMKALSNQAPLRKNRDLVTKLGLRRTKMAKRICMVMKLLMRMMLLTLTLTSILRETKPSLTCYLKMTSVL